MLVPIANSPTRSEFASVCVYFQKSFSSSLFSLCASTRRLSLTRSVSGDRREAVVLLAQEIADHAVDDQRAVDVAGRGEHFAAGQVAPLVGADQAARLQPLVVRIERRGEVAAALGRRAHFLRVADDVDHFRAEAIDLVKIGAHALEHHLAVDVDHVAMAHLPAIDDVGELHARAELVALHVHGQDADLALSPCPRRSPSAGRRAAAARRLRG